MSRARVTGLAGVALALACLVRSITQVTAIPAAYAASDSWRGDALFVPNGDPDGMRVGRATELLKAGRARWLVIAGAGFGGDSSAVLANDARALGADPRALLLEDRSTTTWENFDLARPILEAHGIRSLLIVTHREHARRAVLTARAALPGFDLHALAADGEGPVTLSVRTREVLKTSNQILRGHLPPWSTLAP